VTWAATRASWRTSRAPRRPGNRGAADPLLGDHGRAEFFTDPRVRASSAAVALGSAPWARAIRMEEDFRQVVAEAKGAGATGIKLYADLDSSRMARLSSEAKRQGLSVWAHAR
jgi:hypothetical protein